MSARLTVLKYGDTVFGENYIFMGGEKDKLLPITFCIYLIETKTRRILVDAGCDDGSGFPMSVFCTPVEALASAGLSPSDITDVIITHAHSDHVQASRHFPWANFHIQREEYERAKKHIPESFKVILFEDEQVLDGEIFIKRISGHSHGSSIVLFEHNGKTAVLCGDECYTSRNLTEKIPTGASRDPQVSKAFVEEYSKEKYIAFTCHDPHIMRGQVGSKVLLDQSFSDRI